MRVYVDISALQNDDRVRAVGSYTKTIVAAVKNYCPVVELVSNYDKSVDIVHYSFFDFFFITLPLRKGNKTVVTIHDVIPLLYPKQFPKGIKGFLKLQIQKYSLRS